MCSTARVAGTWHFRVLIKRRNGAHFAVSSVDSPTKSIGVRIDQKSSRACFLHFDVEDDQELYGKTTMVKIAIRADGTLRVLDFPVLFRGR